MATQTDTKEVKEEKPQNLSEAPTHKPDRKKPEIDTWQGGFIQVADALDAQGMHWLGTFFRNVADPPMVTPEDHPTPHASKSGK